MRKLKMRCQVIICCGLVILAAGCVQKEPAADNRAADEAAMRDVLRARDAVGRLKVQGGPAVVVAHG